MPKVSVIMGAYNCARTVTAAIESIKAQTYHDWEFIICDDASSDNTWEVIQRAVQDDPRFILLRNQKNLTLGGTLNRCIEKSTGQYIARQDADDYSLPDRLMEQVEFLDRFYDITVVGTYAELFDRDGKVWGINKPPLNPSIKDWLKGSCIIHPSVMMRRQAVIEVGLYRAEAVRVEDYDLWLRMVSNGYKLVTLPNVLYRFHLDYADYDRKRFKHRINEAKIKMETVKRMNLPPHYHLFALKPAVVGLLPHKLLYWYHYRKFSRLQ